MDKPLNGKTSIGQRFEVLWQIPGVVLHKTFLKGGVHPNETFRSFSPQIQTLGQRDRPESVFSLTYRGGVPFIWEVYRRKKSLAH